jgi:hypothetical protein
MKLAIGLFAVCILVLILALGFGSYLPNKKGSYSEAHQQSKFEQPARR